MYINQFTGNNLYEQEVNIGNDSYISTMNSSANFQQFCIKLDTLKFFELITNPDLNLRNL